MQCKDIPDSPILVGLAVNPAWHTHWNPQHMPSVLSYMPTNTPEKLALAKMKGLLKRGLVGGCGCGCRGDWEITDKGRAWLLEIQ